MAEFQVVCRTADIAVGEAKCFEINGKRIGVYHLPDGFYAIDDPCPHAGASLVRGCIEEDVIHCRIHYWGFGIKDGCAGNRISRNTTYKPTKFLCRMTNCRSARSQTEPGPMFTLRSPSHPRSDLNTTKSRSRPSDHWLPNPPLDSLIRKTAVTIPEKPLSLRSHCP